MNKLLLEGLNEYYYHYLDETKINEFEDEYNNKINLDQWNESISSGWKFKQNEDIYWMPYKSVLNICEVGNYININNNQCHTEYAVRALHVGIFKRYCESNNVSFSQNKFCINSLKNKLSYYIVL